ncbi:MAG: hypothetical protein HYY30_11440 [Chloroflexi bacterium]|nr:hypothetical protein [Chloroflexota bacterium]
MIDFFFPFALLLLTFSVGWVVLALLILDAPVGLLLWARQVLGTWFFLFAAILAGLLAIDVKALLADRVNGQSASTFSSASGLLYDLSITVWIIVFLSVSVVGACFFLLIWSSEAETDDTGIARKLAFGRDRIASGMIDKVVEVVYLYRLPEDIRQVRTKSLFIVVCNGRNPLRRYALFRPLDAYVENEFRDKVKTMAPLATVALVRPLRLPGGTLFAPGWRKTNSDPPERPS